MSAQIHYLDPSGNITAIVVGAAESEMASITAHILDAGLAEQVGYEVDCIIDADACLGRLQMMGGEFCGNASRAYAYFKLSENESSGTHNVKIEISGALSPVDVYVDLDAGTAYTDMPLPLELYDFYFEGHNYPLVCMEGIVHLIVRGTDADADFACRAIAAICEKFNPEACGVQFLNCCQMTPYVFVRESNSLVAESSCGSGSVAAAWYMGLREDRSEYELVQPGGTITVRIDRNADGQIDHCYMGGNIGFVK